jgi:hypothetical protein
MQDDYEGDFNTRRVLIYTLRFTAKTYLYGPISTATRDIIKKSSIGYVAGDISSTPSRDIVYSAEPRAIKNYTGIVLTNLTKDIGIDDTVIEVNDSSSIATSTYLDLEGEELYVTAKTGNLITVERVRDNTKSTIHLAGAQLKPITSTDNALVEEGDDFGFNGSML